MTGMAIYPYRFRRASTKATPIATLIDLLNGKSLGDRNILVGNTIMRLEEISKHADGYYLLDFTKFHNGHGPGKASKDKPVQGFEFEKDEDFGHQTAALFDPKSHHLIIQYNHSGARVGNVAEYFSMVIPDPNNQYEIEPRLDPDAEDRLSKKQIFRKLHFKVDVDVLSAAERANGTALASALSAGLQTGSRLIEVTLQAERSQSGKLNANAIQSIVSQLKRKFGTDAEPSIHVLKVFARESDHDGLEMIDLIAQRLRLVAPLKLGPDRRYPLPQRWRALEHARNTWSKIL